MFCNPPYGRALGAWVRKAYEEAQAGTTVVLLIPARTDTAYFHDYIYGKAEIRFLRGRLHFEDEDGNRFPPAPFPSMVVVYNGDHLGGAGKESLNTERMKLTAEKRKAAEMDNDLRRGDLHSTQDIEKGIQTMCLNIRSRFLAMPAKLSPTLAAMDGNQAAIFDEMKKAIDETLEELSDYRVAFAVEDTADERTEEK